MRASAMNRQGLIDLCEYMRERGSPLEEMAEIGSYAGESAALFALYFEGVWCIDPWNEETIRVASKKHRSARVVEQAFDALLANNHRLHKITSYSQEAAELFEDLSLDFVYIDGDHRYESVREDIRLWRAKVCAGGFIGGHDFGNPNAPEVEKAVLDEIGSPEETFIDHSWVVRKEAT